MKQLADRDGPAPARDETVAVFGSADPAEDEVAYELALRVGAGLAELGYAVVNGGYGGTMRASARGVAERGGKVVGVTCTLWKSAPNEFLTHEVSTNSLQERLNTLIELAGAGFVCLPGATGTLLELAEVWELSAKGLMDVRPIVCVGPFWRPVIELMVSERPKAGRFVEVIDEPAQLVSHFPKRSDFASKR